MSKWDELSMAEKAEMMKVAVRQGITNLSDIKQRYNEFAEGGSKEEEEEVNTIVPFTQRREVIITPDSEYNQYLNTLPDNQRFTPNDKYDSYFYWKLNGRPRNFEEAYNKGMFHYDHSDNGYHANSIAFDDNTGVGYFMKPKTHDTVGYELDWFNKGLVTEEGGKQRPVTPEEAVELEEFRKNYFLTNDPDRPNYYRYQPIEKAEGGGIHIKPSHRGRLTELKKRTGKTEAELYNDGNPAHKKMVVFARNARKWKHELGGNLFDGGGSTQSSSDYRYIQNEDGQWSRVTNDDMGRVFQGLTVTPSKIKTKYVPKRIDNSEEGIKQKERFFRYRDEEGNLIGEPGLEIVSPEFDLLALSPIAKGVIKQGINRAKNVVYDRLNPLGEPIIPEEYLMIEPKIQSLNIRKTTTNIPTLSWTEASDPTRMAAEKGRKMFIDWHESPFYTERWKSAAPFENTENVIDDIVTNARNQKFNFLDRYKINPSGITNGQTYATYTKPFEYKRNGKDIVDYNTGFSIDIASDMGNRADRTAIHELGHLTSGLSDGLAPNTQYGKTIYGKLTDPVVSDYPALNKQIITRGKRYQHFMVDYNDDLLPRRSKLLDDVFNSPDRAVNVFENSGYSRDQAEKLVNRLKTEYNYLWDKQEQQMFLKDWFIKDIKPLLKNPNNATEIEQVLVTHPELVNNNPNVYDIIKTIRPGSIKDYAKYLSASLSTLPFVKKEFKK